MPSDSSSRRRTQRTLSVHRLHRRPTDLRHGRDIDVRRRWPTSTSLRLVSPAVAGALAVFAILTGAEGSDLAAATYRVELFARSGLTLWDSQWYAGHWTFDYSVLFAPVGWLAGIPAMETICAAMAAWAFDRLLVARFGSGGRVGSVAFAVGTLAQVAIGQEPYLLGEALALVALLLAISPRWPLAPVLAAGSSLASPLAGTFLAIAAIAWLIGSLPARPRPIIALVTATLVPLGVLELLFPGQGAMPFPLLNFVGMFVPLVAIAVVIVRYDRVLTAGVAVYSAALVLAFVLPNAVGTNVTRLGACVGVALVAAVAGSRRRGRRLLVLAAVPLALAQWIPASDALLGDGNASMETAYFQPLLRYLRQADRPLGRVEVVPTALHWEAAYVAPFFPLARGWERQLDTVDNPIFYSTRPLTATAYRAWLFANGVRFVALPDVTLDYSAVAEAQLLRTGVPGLRLVWHTVHWHVYEVKKAPGIVSGPARLISSHGSEIRIDVTHPGVVVIREHYVDAWRVTGGRATVTPAPGGWVAVHATHPGQVALQISL